MSKTVDELMMVYDAAIFGGLRTAENHRVGIAAVIRALRDEFGRIMYPGDDWNRQGIMEQFDQILGDAGNEKVVGQDTARPEAIERSTPATDPAPAVCVWNTVAQGWEYDIVERSCTGSEFRVYGSGEHTCPSCKAPIKFTEAK